MLAGAPYLDAFGSDDMYQFELGHQAASEGDEFNVVPHIVGVKHFRYQLKVLTA